MARMDISGMDELIRDIGGIESIPEDVASDMLRSQAAVLVRAQKRELEEKKLVRSGQLRDSIEADAKVKGSKDRRYLDVYPRGNRKKDTTYRLADAKKKSGVRRKVTNTEVGFINEYGAGRKHIPGRSWMESANKKSEAKALEAAVKVYDDWLKSKNL